MAIISATGGLFLLVHELIEKRVLNGRIVYAVILILLAGLLRLHAVWLVIFLFSIPAFILLAKKQLIQWISISLFLVVLLAGFNKLQSNYYQKNIPNWEQQEQMRQALIYIFNRPTNSFQASNIFKDNTERTYFAAGLYYDSSIFTTNRIQEIGNKLVRNRLSFTTDDRTALYWLLMNFKIQLLFILLVAAVAIIFKRTKKTMVAIVSIIAPAIAILSYLFVFQKITPAVLQAVFFIMVIQDES